jgi:magnesium-transporting ATPase (P-type)
MGVDISLTMICPKLPQILLACNVYNYHSISLPDSFSSLGAKSMVKGCPFSPARSGLSRRMSRMEKGSNPQAQNPSDHWWARPPEELLQTLSVDADRGLSADQAAQNREHYGSNRLEDTEPTSQWALLWESVKSPMIVLLLVIAGISLALEQFREAVVMVFVVAMYVGVHLLNKARSDRTMAQLRAVQAPKTMVLRTGEQQEIPIEEIVVGDVVPLQSGSRVPADARLLSSVGLIVNEGALTGESAPVHKQANAEITPDTPLAERETAVFAGTTVLDGQGKALVLAVYYGSLALGQKLESARTTAFATWLLGHFVLALNLKQESIPLFKQGVFSNRFAIGWLIGMIALVLAMTVVPFVQGVLQTTSLSGLQWIMVIAGAVLASMWMELVKWLRPGQTAEQQ